MIAGHQVKRGIQPGQQVLYAGIVVKASGIGKIACNDNGIGRLRQAQQGFYRLIKVGGGVKHAIRNFPVLADMQVGNLDKDGYDAAPFGR